MSNLNLDKKAKTTISSVTITTYLPEVIAHLTNFPQKEVSNSDSGNKLTFRSGADITSVYQVRFFFTRPDNLDFILADLLLWMTPFLAALSANLATFVRLTAVGFFLISEIALRKVSLIRVFISSLFLSALCFLIAPTVTGITAI